MRKCAGCGGNFANTDVCLMATKLRLIRGEKSPDGKRKKTNVHYHMDKKCLETGFNIEEVSNPLNVFISKDQMKAFKKRGIDLNKSNHL